MKHFNFLCKLCIYVASLIFIARFAVKKTDGFSILAISSDRPFEERFITRAPSFEEQTLLETAFNQPYHYFGCGGQAFAFFSQDGNYVIKFFKQRLFRPSYVLNAIPLPKFLHRFRNKRNWKRRDKLERDFFSYKVAYEQLQEQTGIIYSHLQKTTHLQKRIEVIDRLGIHHFLNLDQFDFVVQKRAERVYDKIDSLMRTGMLQEAEQGISEVFQLIITRAKLGFRDRDPNIRTNCGFIGAKAVKIDVGRFVVSEQIKTPEGIKEEVTVIIQPFRNWLEKAYPELMPHLLYEYERVVNSL